MKCCDHDCTQGRDCPAFRPARLLWSLLSLIGYLAVSAALVGIAWFLAWAIWSPR
jgi:hypothetical protein